MTRPRTTTSPTDALGATLSDSKSRLINLEAIAHRHETVPLAPLNSPVFTGTPRYAAPANPYGWHLPNQPIGTQMVIGAFGQGGYSFTVANTWYTIGQVNITVPTAVNTIMMTFGFTMYTGSAGGFLVRFQYANGGATVSSDLQYYKNEAYSHFNTAGVRGLLCTPGTSGLAWLQVYGQGISLVGDSNDNAYFTVHTP